MSLLDKVSLCITPNAYKESKLYSVVPNTTLGDMDVVRATTATRVNSAGLIEVVPRNLLTYSEDFSNVSWTKARGSITSNVTTAPNGTLTADKFIPDTQINPHFIYEGASGITIGNLYNLSVYAKISEWNTVALFRTDSTIGVSFRLDTQTSNILIGTPTSYSITSVGNGWFRLSVSFPATSASDGIQIRVGNNSLYSIAGNNLDGLFLWGAQLNEGTTATEYFPTTTRLNIPRIDYTNGSCPSLLVEPQRTNLVTSSDPTAYTSLGGSGIVFSTFNWGIGLISNSLYYPNNSLDRYYYIPCVNSTTYAISFFAKKDDLTIPKVGNTIVDLTLDLIMDNVDSFTDIQYKLISNNVYRVSGKILSGANFNVVGIRKRLTNSNNGIRISGLQLEAGTYPTSYIPTIASTVTRNADVISKTGISSLIGQTEGTVLCDINLTKLSDQKSLFTIDNGTTNEYISLIRNSTNIFSLRLKKTGTSAAIVINSIVINDARCKIGIAYKNGDYAMYVNGVLRGTSANSTDFPTTALIQFVLSSANYGTLNDSYNLAVLWQTRLTNDELATLTTI
jgi:hypothetical protein